MTKAWVSESQEIETWLMLNYGTASIERWIEETAIRLFRQSNQEKLPLCLESLFGSRRILRKEIRYVNPNELTMKGCGRLEAEKSGLVLVVNRPQGGESPSRRRERFTIAHEIAHSFFYDLSSDPPQKIFFRLHNQRYHERLCDKLAAAILIPKNKIERLVKSGYAFSERNFRIDRFRQLLVRTTAIFDVSLAVAARRVIEDLGFWNIVVLGCGWHRKESESKKNGRRGESWRLEWFAKPAWADTELFLPTEGLPKIHLEIAENLYQTADRRNYMSGKEDVVRFRLGNLRKLLHEKSQGEKEYQIFAALIKESPKNSELFTTCHRKGEVADRARRRGMKMVLCIPLYSS